MRGLAHWALVCLIAASVHHARADSIRCGGYRTKLTGNAHHNSVYP